MAVEYIGYGAPDGTCIGLTSSELVAFHGTAPCDQAAAILTALTTGVVLTTGAGFASTAQLQLMVDALNAVIVALREKGIIAT